ncbi:nitrilotriacetate monooxygenase [Roseovarius atlanticus]|uniref:Nitrilotriacetate monooxygenase n=1 Tax=Roseovarius atlanticus TaxID=1641875 RepID=A0A0T5NSZ2_9RHOB|nr:flavin reductase family protein [Roseovarius atlanticus]KRS11920.1 nitrilotriacetate monooxygenase [Roseovarius atlanticus]
MHYGRSRPEELPFNPFKAIIAPRPIGWIGTLNAEGVANLAPYSFFNGVGSGPDMVMFASEGAKNSYINARDAGEFTFSLVTAELTDAMNISSENVPDGIDEFELAGLEQGRSVEIQAPFVAASPAALECVTVDAFQLKDRQGALLEKFMIIGEVVQTHIKDEFIKDGLFATTAAQPIARMGYRDYTSIATAWNLARPDDPV